MVIHVSNAMTHPTGILLVSITLVTQIVLYAILLIHHQTIMTAPALNAIVQTHGLVPRLITAILVPMIVFFAI